MKTVVIITLFTMTFRGFGQTLNKTEIDTALYESGKIKSITYVQNYLKTKVIEYQENGNILAEHNFKNNKEHGKTTYYSSLKNGEITQTRFYENDLLNGLFIQYYSNGTIYSKSLYKNGREDSSDVWFYPNGNKRMVRCHKDGKLDGPITLYNENGKITSERNYKIDKVERITYYYENGNLKYTGAFKDDKMFGERLCYDENGKPANGNFTIYEDGIIERECICINGKPEGQLKVYDQYSCLIKIVNFKNGKPDGPSYRYSYVEKLYPRDQYKDGVFVKELKNETT